MIGMVPAALATGIGSDVQRPGDRRGGGLSIHAVVDVPGSTRLCFLLKSREVAAWDPLTPESRNRARIAPAIGFKPHMP